MAIHPRNQRYKDLILCAPYEICIERARYYTQSYRETEGEHPALRAAKAFAHTARNMTVYILDDEGIVGNRSSKLVATVIPVERGDLNAILEAELGILLEREDRPYHIGPRERRELEREILPYWRGKTVRNRKKELWDAHGLFLRPAFSPTRLLRLRRLARHPLLRGARLPRFNPLYAWRGIREVLYNNPAFVMNVFDVQGHLILGHRNVLREGFRGIRVRAQERLVQARAAQDTEAAAFLEGVIICCDAMGGLAARFADEADRLSGQTPDAQRKLELRAIAVRCRHVPFDPPRDFREAVQALWLTQAGAMISYGAAGILAIGRFDQYLYPFYAADKAAGRITDDEVVGIIEELLIKLSYNLLLIPNLAKRVGSELGSDSCAPTVGGLTPEGNDAVNDLSYLILDAFANVRSLGNTFSIRLSRKSPETFWRKALDTYRHTSGAALFSDETVVRALQGCGVTERDARDYGVIGCVEPTSDGNTFGCTSGNDISLTGALEMALLDGRLRIMNKRIGPATGDARAFRTFDEVMTAFKTQAAFMVRMIAKAVNLKDTVYRDGFPNPLVSATLAGCVETGRDMTAGGALYNFGSIGARGFATAVDALAAIKHFVFDERLIAMRELIHLLDTNFRGQEALRLRLARRGPKYGADNDAADGIAKDVAAFVCREVAAQKTIRGGPFRPGFFSYGMHILEGMFLGATPNGRLAGEPVSNSFSPCNCAETNGPTAVMRSVAKIDHTLISNGCALNMRWLPSLFDSEAGIAAMVALVRSYFALGGMEVQFNVVSNATLRDAQKHPENYRDLSVRVSGYSALFTDLGKPLQDEIIARTTFEDPGDRA